MRWSARAVAGALALGAGLAGCTTLAPPATADITTGRFALTIRGVGSDGAPRSESQSGRFTLAQAGAVTTLDLATPLGTTLARLQASPAGARLQVPEAGGLREVSEPDAEALAERVLGFPLPLAGLPAWVRGVPLASRPAVPLTDADGFRQDDWRVRFDERYGGALAPRPRRLTLARDATAVAPAITLRIVLDDPP